jgi:ubiquinone/menaquinone biosynthesis C-methylase UbiE
MSDKISWEEAVTWYCRQKSNRQAVLDNYFDENIVDAAERFSNSNEFVETLKFLPQPPQKLLEIGSGRGIASYSFAKRGYEVTAIEPDPGDFIGSGSIKKLIAQTQTPITIKEDIGEHLPFADGTFNIVYVRQVLHHANDLDKFCREINRVLVKNGKFIAVREHVISHPKDLQIFLNNHPLHKLYGGENAYTLNQYQSAIENNGLIILRKLGPYDSDINLFPSTREQIKASLLLKNKLFRIDKFSNLMLKYFNYKNKTPGRLYSFIAYRP